MIPPAKAMSDAMSPMNAPYAHEIEIPTPLISVAEGFTKNARRVRRN
jgi:hypothetical protein